jgi:hypothetical protein
MTERSLHETLHEKSKTDNQLVNRRIELKFLLDDTLTDSVKDWARQYLGVDAHCDPQLGDSYEVNTLYLDSLEFDVFHQRQGTDRCKHRLRCYGTESTVWLESKRKRRLVVHKNRTAVNLVELRRLREHANPNLTDKDASAPMRPEWVAERSNLQLHSEDALPWCGDWFIECVVQRRLKPTVLVHYRRFARTARIDGADLRLTIDSEMQARPMHDWKIAPREGHALAEIGPPGKILELKFHNTMPALFKQLLQQYPILATRFSKFRTAVETCFPEVAAECTENESPQERRRRTG